MALKKTVKTNQGFDAVDAYHRVEGLRLNSKDSITFQVRAYKDNTETIAFSDIEYACAYAIDGANPIKQAYDYIKILPEFDDAFNC